MSGISVPDFVSNPEPDVFLGQDYLVIDFETTNLEKGDPINEDNKIVLLAWKKKDKKCVVCEPTAKNVERLLREVSSSKFIIAHNAKFECGWLKRLGVDLSTVITFCTQVAEYTLRSNRRGSVSLAASLARRNLGGKDKFISAMMKSGICPSEMPSFWLKKYASIDVEQCEKLYLSQVKKLFEENLEKVFYTKCLQVPVLADIEFNGMFLDHDKVRIIYEEKTTELKRVEAQLDEITGGLNPRSNKQMSGFLYDGLGFNEPVDYRGEIVRTPKGERSASSAAIGLLKPKTKEQKVFLEIKQKQSKLNAQVTKSLEKFMQCCDEGNSVLHASINQCITATGRYSSTGKNYSCQFQNIERGFKSLFKARKEGWLIGEADEAQLEFRVAVWFGDDAAGREDIKNGVDAHADTARIIKVDRQEAKSHTFKPLYGGTSGTRNERKYYKFFREKFSGVTKEQDTWVDTALIKKKLVLATGIKFYFPDIKMTSSGYIEGNTNVRNYPVQYLATAEIVPIALVFAWHAMKKANLESFIINTIHDSIISEINPSERNFFANIMSKSLEDFPVKYMKKLYGIDFDVPLGAELKTGTHWGK